MAEVTIQAFLGMLFHTQEMETQEGGRRECSLESKWPQQMNKVHKSEACITETRPAGVKASVSGPTMGSVGGNAPGAGGGLCHSEVHGFGSPTLL